MSTKRRCPICGDDLSGKRRDAETCPKSKCRKAHYRTKERAKQHEALYVQPEWPGRSGFDWTVVEGEAVEPPTDEEIATSARHLLAWNLDWYFRTEREPILAALGPRRTKGMTQACCTANVQDAHRRRYRDPRAWLRVHVGIARVTRDELEGIFEKVRLRALDKAIVSAAEKVDAGAEKVDEGFRVTQRDWLELRANVVTLSRLLRARHGGESEQVQEFEEAFSPFLK